MQTKAPNPIAHLQGRSTLPIIEAYFEFNHLKQLYRQGWLHRGVPPLRCESVADHTFGLAVLALFLAEAYFPHLDLLKVMRMALLHDFGEIYAGDITPHDPVSPEEKHRLESQSIHQVLSKLPNGADYIAIWEEYEQNESAEALFVHQIDRLEMVLQAGVYEYDRLADVSEFFATVEAVLTSPELREVLDGLTGLRPQPVDSPEAGRR